MTIVKDDVTYEILEPYRHVYTKEKRYRVKRTYTSGGIDYITLNDEDIEKLKG